MEYKDFFSPETLEKLNKKSAENLKAMTGDKNLMQTLMSSQQLLSQIIKAEAPYKAQLEKLAVDMVKELYPIIAQEGIELDAKIVSISDVNKTLDEIQITPSPISNEIIEELIDEIIGYMDFYYDNKEIIEDDIYHILKDIIVSNYPDLQKIPFKSIYNVIIKRIKKDPQGYIIDEIQITPKQVLFGLNEEGKFTGIVKLIGYSTEQEALKDIQKRYPSKISTYGNLNDPISKVAYADIFEDGDTTFVNSLSELNEEAPSEADWGIVKYTSTLEDPTLSYVDEIQDLTESISPESRRRIINAITQGAALRGAFAFYLFKEHLDEIDSSLVEKYNQIMKNSFGIYDDENAIAMLLAQLAQGYKTGGGSSKVILNEIQIQEATSGIKIIARAICFPMLVHELIKGLYELISLQGFKGDKVANQAVVDKVDLLQNEPLDIRYGKFIFDALNDVFANSDYDDPRIREFFFAEVYQLDDDEFISFIENALNERLTPNQQRWINTTLKEIAVDLKSDDYAGTGLDEIQVKTPKTISRDKALEIKEWIQDELVDSISNIADEFGSPVSTLLDENNSYYEVIKDFIVDQMILNNYEIVKGYKEILISQSNKNILTHQDIVDYLDINPEVKNYLEKIFWSYYFESIEFNSITTKILQLILNKYGLDASKTDVEYFVQDDYDGILPWPDEIIYDPKFDSYLYSQLLKSDKLDEIQISIPSIKNKDSIKNAPVLNIKIGKYDVSKERKGMQVAFNSENISTPTKNRVLAVFDKLGIKPQKAWIGWIVENGQIQSLKSTFVLSYYNGEPILISQLQTSNPAAGQIYLYSKYFKSGKGMRLPDGEHKLDNSSLFADKNATKEQILKALKIPDSSSEEKTQINEFNEKTILSTIERWKEENSKVDDKLARQLINRFDQVKGSLATKLDIVSLSDELKQNKNYLNIDKYSFDDMSKLIRSLPESPEKVKKDAIASFVEKEQIDKTTAQSYVARFLNKKDALKYAVENGTEDGSFTKEEVRKYIPPRLLSNNGYLDPRNWTWKAFEQMLDAIFPSYKKADSEEGENLASTDADKVYDKGGIEIYKGDDVNKCISYNPVTAAGRKKYGWCVTQPGNTNYDYYRFQITAPTFYFIFDRDKPSTPEHSPFEDNWHAFVIQANADGESYVVTDASNRGDRKAESWEAISKLVPSDTWSKIQGLKSYFKPIPLSAVERGRKFASGKSLSVDEFKELAQDEKILYVQGKASKNALSPEIQKILPKYKISLEGRSTTLANVAIDSGQVFPYSSLKDHESLAKRYAVFRFRHTDYSKKPIPLPYVKYLDKDAQQKYLDTYADQFLSYNLIEKFFDKNILEKYIDEEAKKFKYIQPQYIKYIKDPNIKSIYELYNKTNQDWIVDADADLSEEALENLNSMPAQNVTPVPFTVNQWNKFSPKERQLAIELSSKFSNDTKYKDMLYSFPYVIKDGSNTYVLLPSSNQDFDYSSWALVDINGKIIKDDISGFSTIGDNSLINGFPNEDEKGALNRVYNIKDLKID